MALQDPTSGAGYNVGDILPSDDIEMIALQQPRALDAVAGGSYATAGAISLTDGGGSLSVAVPLTLQTNYLGLSSRTLNRVQPRHVVFNANSRFSWSDTAMHWFQSNVTDAGNVQIELTKLVDGGTLTGFTIHAHGNLLGGGAHAGFPGTMPSFSLYRTTETIAGPDLLGGATLNAVTDFGNSILNYDEIFSKTVTLSPSIAIDSSVHQNFYLVVTGENGANKQTGFTLFSITANFTVTQCKPG